MQQTGWVSKQSEWGGGELHHIWLHLYNNLKRQNYRNREKIRDSQASGKVLGAGKVGVVLKIAITRDPWVMEMISTLTVVVDVRTYTYNKTA